MREMIGLAELRRQGRMTWMEPENGWVAAPEDILTALGKDGFAERGSLSPTGESYRDEGGEG